MKPVILWADDEIDILRPHIIFLESRGYEVITATAATDAIDIVASRHVDLVILDENMPGLSGLDALTRLKDTHPQLPAVMITKSEEEEIMDRAIGSKIADYLLKPVNPRQILSAIKKALDAPRLEADATLSSFRSEFGRLSARINSCRTLDEWAETYKKLARWHIDLESSPQVAMMLTSLLDEANLEFGKLVKREYASWVNAPAGEAPLMSHNLMERLVLPAAAAGERPWLVVIDNFRYDQWLAIKPVLSDSFTVASEQLCCSILPTSTQYARNAMFAGMTPAAIARTHPDIWVSEDHEGSKNDGEERLIAEMLRRRRLGLTFSYSKAADSEGCSTLAAKVPDMARNDFNVVVINFIDMLSHARTDNRAVRELASTDAAYRSITASWMRHSGVAELFERLARTGSPVILATDHGTVRVDTPVTVVGERDTSDGVRYKTGRKLDADPRRVMEERVPARMGLPARHMTSSYIFALGRDYFVYPNNRSHFVQRFADTYQHGGISLEEMLVPAIRLISR